MRYFAAALLALSVLAGAGVAAQAATYPVGPSTTAGQEPSPN